MFAHGNPTHLASHPCPLFPYLLLLLLAGKDLYPTLQNTLPRDKRRHRPTDVVRLQRAAGWGTSLKTTRPGTERVLPTLGASPGRGALGHRVCQWHEWLCEHHAVTARISPVKVLCDRGHANGRRLLWSSPVVQSHLSGPSPGAPWLTLWPSGSLQAGRPRCPSRRSWKRQGFCPGAPQGARSCQRLAVGLRASGSERE